MRVYPLLLLAGVLAAACGNSKPDEPGADEHFDSTTAELTPAQAALAQWSAVIPLSLVPAAGANLPDGKVLLWAADDRFRFGLGGQTYMTTFNPATSTATERLVNETDHNMFCPGTANLPDGRIFVNGGLDAGTTSIYDPTTGEWSVSDTMNIPRAYQGTAPLADGSVFTLGGSWAGGVGNKHGELWTEATGWHTLSGVLIDPFLSVDPTRTFGPDSHLWLLPTGNGKIFHAGPGVNMHWIDTQGNGSVSLIGPRGDDEFSINGGIVMFDAGKILKVGGAAMYDTVTANTNTYVMDVAGDTVTVRKVQGLTYRRGYHNTVVLPNGQVVVIGGQTFLLGFSDNNSVLVPEIFDPATETWTSLPAMTVPRNYHSIAILLADGRVLSGGGGLCADCPANHADLEILSPPYLFNADGTLATRPVIQNAPTQAAHGTQMLVKTNSPVASFSLVRMSSTTHTVNNDQRRLSLTHTALGGNSYEVDVPSNPGWALPGYYMLFAMKANGVPSVARTVLISAGDVLSLVVSNQQTNEGTTVSLQLTPSNPGGGDLTFDADGLPPGLTLNPDTGLISGSPTTPGDYPVEVSVTDGTQTTSTEFIWVVLESSPTHAVTLDTPAPPSVGVGESTSLLLEAEDAQGHPLTFSALGLPPGLTLDPSTGLIAGVTTMAGNFSVTVSASDAFGNSDTAQFSWLVGNAPPIVEPVVAPLLTSGNTATYAASATGGGTLQYKWSFGDGSPATGFGTNPNVSHTFPGPGVYTVTLTVRNENGGSTSTEFLQAIGGPVVAGQPVASGNLIFTSGAEGPRLFVVNIDNDSVSAFNATTRQKLAEIPVGNRPRGIAGGPDGRVWVTNAGSSTLSVIDPASLSVSSTVKLRRGSQPFGIVAGSNGNVFVALEATGEVQKLSAAGKKLATATVGGNPRHLALRAAGDRLLVSRFITLPQPGEATADVETEIGGQKQGGEVLIYNTSNLSLRSKVVLQHSNKPDTTIGGRGVPNYLGAPVVSPDGQSAWVPSKQDNIMRGMLRDGVNLDFQNTVRAISSRINLTNETEDYPARIDYDNSGIATAAAFHPSGAYMFVALEASRHVAVVDAFGRRELFRIDVGRAPQALAVSTDGLKLYVHNALDRTVSAHNLNRLLQRGERELPLQGTMNSVATEALSAQVLKGKRLFYDARSTKLARDAYLSCATCHNDGGHDGRTWDLTGFGEGLRNTINLRGRAGAESSLHWTANFDEVQDFESQIRGLAGGTGLMNDADFFAGTRSDPLGDAKTGVSSDLDALAAYVASLSSFDVSPYRLSASKLTPEAESGRLVFGFNCVNCHGGSAFTDSAAGVMHDVGTIKPSSGERLGEPLTGLDSPTLRDVWATAPFLHDGSAPTIQAAIDAHTSINLSGVDLLNVSAFVNQIGSEESAPQGLRGDYFVGKTLSGQPVLQRIEKVNFAWDGTPKQPVPADNFSVRWTGSYLAPSSGEYRFRTVANDGVRLWLDGVQVIDSWINRSQQATLLAAPVQLVSGQRVAVRLEFYDNTEQAVIRLQARVPGATGYAAIPPAQLLPL